MTFVQNANKYIKKVIAMAMILIIIMIIIMTTKIMQIVITIIQIDSEYIKAAKSWSEIYNTANT